MVQILKIIITKKKKNIPKDKKAFLNTLMFELWVDV